MRTARTKWNLICLFFAVLASLFPRAIAQDVPRLQLKVKEVLPVPGGMVRWIGTLGSPKCDGQGNIYYKATGNPPFDLLKGPLVRISADGRHVVNISADTVPDFRNDGFIGTRPLEVWSPELGEAAPADDGNIYLMRAGEKPLILVISPAGELVRRLTLDPPGPEYQGHSFSVAGGMIIMAFFKPNNDKQNSGTKLYSLYDAETGERQLDYDPPPDAGIFACYTPNQFTFFGIRGDGISIIHAVTR